MRGFETFEEYANHILHSTAYDVGRRAIDAAGFPDLRQLLYLLLMPGCESCDLAEELLVDVACLRAATHRQAEDVCGQNRGLVRAVRWSRPLASQPRATAPTAIVKAEGSDSIADMVAAEHVMSNARLCSGLSRTLPISQLSS